MFHFDPFDDLCPSYLQKNTTKQYFNTFIEEKNNNKSFSSKITATSA